MLTKISVLVTSEELLRNWKDFGKKLPQKFWARKFWIVIGEQNWSKFPKKKGHNKIENGKKILGKSLGSNFWKTKRWNIFWIFIEPEMKDEILEKQIFQQNNIKTSYLKISLK